jgi:hypothetical protein
MSMDIQKAIDKAQDGEKVILLFSTNERASVAFKESVNALCLIAGDYKINHCEKSAYYGSGWIKFISNYEHFVGLDVDYFDFDDLSPYRYVMQLRARVSL